jgi:RNA-binding protein
MLLTESPMPLTEQQFSHLRILGHDLKPVVDIGAGGLTESVLKQVDQALAEHEMLKVRVPFGNRARRDKLIDVVVPRACAVLVRRSSYEAVLYRPSPKGLISFPGGSPL